MPSERVEVLVVGGGQAGLAMSEHLSAGGVPHLVLERHRIAERWRSGRWDSLVANGPAWHDRFPVSSSPTSTLTSSRRRTRSRTTSSLTRRRSRAPIRCGVEVTSVRRNEAARLPSETSDGTIEAATWSLRPGRFSAQSSRRSCRRCRADADPLERLSQSGSIARRCGAGGRGGVVGGADRRRAAARRAAASTCRSARTTGRRALSRARLRLVARGARRVGCRGSAQGTEHVTIAVSGALAAIPSISATSRLAAWCWWSDDIVRRAARCSSRPIWARTSREGDANYLSLLDEADAYVARNGLDLPEEPEARESGADPDCVTDPWSSWTWPAPV